MSHIIHGGRVNKANNSAYFPGCRPGSRADSDNISPDSRANNIYSPGSDKLTEVQLYMSTSSCPAIR